MNKHNYYKDREPVDWGDRALPLELILPLSSQLSPAEEEHGATMDNGAGVW